MRTQKQTGAAMAIGLSLVVGAAFAQTRKWEPLYPRPLDQVRFFLENEYEKPVTYEDPVWRWIGDSEPVGRQLMFRGLSNRHFDLPTGVTRGENQTLDLRLVQRVIDAYHQQNPGDTRFRVFESSMGLHIVPALVHDENGALVEPSNLLDTRITVLPAMRMASEHFRAITGALASASGIKIDMHGPSLDYAFAANNAVPPKAAVALLNAEQKLPYSFRWGTSAAPAREALIQLIASSNTTLSWALLCDADLKSEDGACTLNVVPLAVTRPDPNGKPGRVYRTFDRCGTCDSLKR